MVRDAGCSTASVEGRARWRPSRPVTELHVYFDVMTFMQQLGVGGPAPAKTAAR